ncbi:Flagellar P-ring protein [Gemmatirosa kalamazoonensis]|uniref:Flagellar P-ring protein n=1 Tax=Gemmatirosa kalamazoonensis TaxID=861299 RepID=W0R9I8_9BACT|nr:flagellar basal body P-ring protein FlgI [Gemmatirosa kalamazoonensis]AHG87754.1 Flagellar P-ring protein [Gemmatirosa kalamazoonensis]
MRRYPFSLLRAALRNAVVAPPKQTATDYAALGRLLAEYDARALETRRAADARRRRLALAMGTVVVDEPTPSADAEHPPRLEHLRLTPFQAFAAVAVPAKRGLERAVALVVAELADSVRDTVRRPTRSAVGAVLLALGALAPAALRAQDVRIKDLTIAEGAAPIRLVGYGLAVGLDGTGDRANGVRGSGMTVQSVVNLLRRFDVEVPAELLRTRNVAAVLVTAEVSPYLRSGGRFDVHVASMGDARSLRGGVLWMTPLVAEAGGKPYALAQGALMVSESADPRDRYAAPTVETTVRLPNGGQLEVDLPRPSFAGASRLLLKEPDVGTASKIAAAINGALGAKTATVEDPGAVALALPDTGDRALMLSKVRDLAVRPDRIARLVIDGRDGTVVAGGDMTVGEAVVSHGAVTLTIGAQTGPAPAPGDTSVAPGDVRVTPGTTVQKVAAALHAVQTPAPEIAAIFLALREVGALAAEVVVR